MDITDEGAQMEPLLRTVRLRSPYYTTQIQTSEKPGFFVAHFHETSICIKLIVRTEIVKEFLRVFCQNH